MPMLWRKLWADTRALARQAGALMLLIGLGVLLYVGLYGAYQNLTSLYDHIYESTRFAHASVLVEAAPETLVNTAMAIPHVRAAIGRVVGDGAIIQRGRKRERVLGRFVGCPRGRRPAINDLWIVEGRYLADAGEAVLEHQFAAQSGYRLGDHVKCSYESRRREFTVVGFAVSPEYVYPVPSKHTLFVSRGTFGVVFIDEDRAREWFGMGRQITEVHCLTEPGHEAEVLGKLKGLARSYGLETSYVQDEQPSKRLLRLDQQGFANLSVFFPILFLTAAGLSLYGALSRIVRLQVMVIGTLKACGLGERDILLQHILQGVLIGLAGAVPGVALGHWMASALYSMYAEALHLPVLPTELHWDTVSTGLLLAAATGLAASYLPARTAARLPPAVAMRGELESPRGRMVERRLVERTQFAKVLLLIPLRGVFRRASRTLLAVAGIAGGASIIMTTLGTHVATMDAVDEVLTGSRKYEIDLQFTRPAARAFARSVTALPGTEAISFTASVPVRIRTRWGSGEAILTGLERGQRLLRVHTVAGGTVQAAAGKVWLPRQLAERLLVEPGDPVSIEWVKSGRRRRLRRTMRVAGITDVAMGSTAYGEYNDVRRSLADRAFPHSSYGAFVACEPGQTEPLKRRLERSDDVALVSTTEDVTKEVNEQMALMYLFIGILLSFGTVLAGSSIHSVATISLLERTRELATLRSLGFSAATTAWLAALELSVLAGAGLVVGIPLGKYLNTLFIASFTTENMAFRAILPPWIHLTAIMIVFGLVALSSYAGMRRLRTMDLPQATKARE
ncbi:MAG: ABC transporter permease [Armatimonadota bacterium]